MSPARTPLRTQDEVRRHNLSMVLREVHRRGATSRAELTETTGLNRSTIGVLVSELESVGLVREGVPVARGGAGRPSIMVLPADDVYVIAVDIGVDHLSAARVGLGGQVRARKVVAQGRTNPSVSTVVNRLATLVMKVSEGAPRGARCVGVGASVCGVVRQADGLVRFCPNLGWVDVPLAQILGDRFGFGLPVVLGNDADLGVLAEVARGAALGCRDVVYLSGEVGLGGGVLVAGQPLQGAGGYAGEIGHMVVNPTGRTCRCGSRGCWETEVGEEALIAHRAGKPGRGRAAAREVIEAAAGGDRESGEVLDRVAWWLGVGIGNLVNVFNPEVVLLGGLLHDVFPVVQDRVREVACSVALAAPGERVQVCASKLGEDSSLLGAAEVAFSSLLGDPLGAGLNRAS